MTTQNKPAHADHGKKPTDAEKPSDKGAAQTGKQGAAPAPAAKPAVSQKK